MKEPPRTEMGMGLQRGPDHPLCPSRLTNSFMYLTSGRSVHSRQDQNRERSQKDLTQQVGVSVSR